MYLEFGTDLLVRCEKLNRQARYSNAAVWWIKKKNIAADNEI